MLHTASLGVFQPRYFVALAEENGPRRERDQTRMIALVIDRALAPVEEANFVAALVWRGFRVCIHTGFTSL